MNINLKIILIFQNDNGTVAFVGTVYNMLHTMTSDLRQYDDVHYKAKTLMCYNAEVSFQCASKQLEMLRGGLRPEQINFVNITLMGMHNVLSSMCRESTCAMMDGKTKYTILHRDKFSVSL